MRHKTTNIKNCLFALALAFTTNIWGQTKVDNEEKPYIEVTGTADQEITPDEIYINIIIREKYVNKEKVTIESQEEKLKNYLKEIHVDISNLSLSDANADYVKIKWRTKDVLTKKDYTLKVSNATTVGQVFQQLDKLEIEDAFINKINHSKLDSLKRELKISAIKAAKNKADYLLTAIGEHTGKPLIVQERENANTQMDGGIVYRGSRSSPTSYYIDGVKVLGSGKAPEIEFKKIKIDAFIYVKFAIK